MGLRNRNSKSVAESFKEVGPYLGLGTQLAATIIIMFFIGRWIDIEYNTTPIFVIVFSFLGGTAGVYNFIKTVLDLNKKKYDKKS